MLQATNLAARLVQIPFKVSPFAAVQAVARSTIDALFGANRSFVGSQSVQFTPGERVVFDTIPYACGLSMLPGVDAVPARLRRVLVCSCRRREKANTEKAHEKDPLQ